MSRFTALIHARFGTGAPNETAADIIVRHIPDTGQLGAVKEVITDAVAVMQGTGLSGAEKKKLVTTVVTFALARLGLSVPASVVSYLIEEAVLLLKGGASTPDTPAPVVDPTQPVYPSLEAAKAAWSLLGDVTTNRFIVIERSIDSMFQLEPKGVGPLPGVQVWPNVDVKG